MNKTLRNSIFFLLGILIIYFAFASGGDFYSPKKLWHILLDKNCLDHKILLNIRFPRIILALLCGSMLAVSGALFQAMLRNPLADPYILGVANGAALGAAFGIIFNFNNSLTILLAFGGSLFVATSISLIARKKFLGNNSLLLAGISLSFILSAAVMLLFALADPVKVHKALLWQMGDLSQARYNNLYYVIPFALALIIFAFFLHKKLDLIAFDSDLAKSSGISKTDLYTLFWLAAILTAIAVSLGGVIGFIGLIVPHVIRLLWGPSHKKLIPLSAIIGGLFLLFCDTISRSIIYPSEIPSGVITSFFGGIFFLSLLLRKGEQ